MKGQVSGEHSWAITYGEDFHAVANQVPECWESAFKLEYHVCVCVCVCVYDHVRIRSTRWRSWLRHCATSRMVAGSIPHGVIGIFH